MERGLCSSSSHVLMGIRDVDQYTGETKKKSYIYNTSFKIETVTLNKIFLFWGNSFCKRTMSSPQVTFLFI